MTQRNHDHAPFSIRFAFDEKREAPAGQSPACAVDVLWKAANQARQLMVEDVDVTIRRVPAAESEGEKSLSGVEEIIVLFGLATLASKPLLTFVRDLLEIFFSKRRHRAKLKTAHGEIDLEGDRAFERLEAFLREALEAHGTRAREALDPTRTQLPDANVEILLDPAEDPQQEDTK